MTRHSVLLGASSRPLRSRQAMPRARPPARSPAVMSAAPTTHSYQADEAAGPLSPARQTSSEGDAPDPPPQPPDTPAGAPVNPGLVTRTHGAASGASEKIWPKFWGDASRTPARPLTQGRPCLARGVPTPLLAPPRLPPTRSLAARRRAAASKPLSIAYLQPHAQRSCALNRSALIRPSGTAVAFYTRLHRATGCTAQGPKR
ncbi:hypothetical protein RA210_U10562 [Rubrivivax sp. A210]|nr:hypothetical protein RA210_U10562 [Rubrivivax sp. A210]